MLRHYAVISLALSIFTANAQDSPKLGPEWLARVKDPKTRIAALYEQAKESYGENTPPDPEEFAAAHANDYVFPCPQPNKPGAWAIVNIGSWHETRERLCGIDEKEDFPTHPLETQRRMEWKQDQSDPTAPLKPWHPGQPWFESVSGFLVDESGNQIGDGFFASPGIIADFNHDGMLDLLEISRLHLDNPDRRTTCVMIGALDDTRPLDLMLYCDFREGGLAPKSASFKVRKNEAGKLELVVFTAGENRKETAFAFDGKSFEPVAGEIPDGILMDHPTDPDSYEASRSFLKRHGMEFSGTGSDDMGELLEDLRPDAKSIAKWKAPVAEGSPRERALTWVSSHIPPSRKSGYELVSQGDPVPTPEAGWIEIFNDGGGWGEKSVTVRWLKEDGAEEWTQVDADNFTLAKIPAAVTALDLAVLHEIALVRSVPTDPLSTRIESDQGSGDDFTSIRVRAASDSPGRVSSVFGFAMQGLWKMEKVGNVYDRGLAATVAVDFARKPRPEGEVRHIRTMAAEWLNPENVGKIPPGLASAAIKSIGTNKWEEQLPLLQKLKASLGEPSKDELRFAELEGLIRDADKERYKANSGWQEERKFRNLYRENAALVEKLTGTPGYELRKYLDEALAAF